MKPAKQSPATTIEFEGERYILLPPDTPVPGEDVVAHYQVTTLTGEAVYESYDAGEACKTAVVFVDLLGGVLINIRREQTWWQLQCDPGGAQTAFVVRATEQVEVGP